MITGAIAILRFAKIVASAKLIAIAIAANYLILTKLRFYITLNLVILVH